MSRLVGLSLLLISVGLYPLVRDTLKYDKEGSLRNYREVFAFWRMVKDKDDFVIPLLLDLYDKAGLELPPCLMSLPTELKLKILESLPASQRWLAFVRKCGVWLQIMTCGNRNAWKKLRLLL
ncbi:unnamed protein product [Arabis nemorensis]|uniref:F-box domain-containing protein n=1 Tax=Arabis nemorensis TaxID=586526 RepID=A0A565B3A0_9BRAS|nr:unnamed protein product [Arabis nemorensis]